MNEYKTILWIDASSQETARCSYMRCARTLRLSEVTSPSSCELHDEPAVHGVLQWLRDCDGAEPWLVIVDNADDLSWDVGRILPHGQAGSIIITSQDSRASSLLGPTGPGLKVDVMDADEAAQLLFTIVGCKDMNEGIVKLANGIAALLDRLPLAIELAGARIRSEIEDGESPATVMTRYMNDFQNHRDVLLRSDAFVRLNPGGKSLWTAWQTSLDALRRLEAADEDVKPLSFLIFLSQFDRSNIQRELFRLASSKWANVKSSWSWKPPRWLDIMLIQRENDEWDDYYYRAGIHSLQRYGLIQLVQDAWPGVTMHGLIQWRSSQEGVATAYHTAYVAFMFALCQCVDWNSGAGPFRRHLVSHLSDVSRIIEHTISGGASEPWTVWRSIINVWFEEGRLGEAEQLALKSNQRLTSERGEEDLIAVTTMAVLAHIYREQGYWQRAKPLAERVLQIRETRLGATDPGTIKSISDLADVFVMEGDYDQALVLQERAFGLQKDVLGAKHPDTVQGVYDLALVCAHKGEKKRAQDLMEQAISLLHELYGPKHASTLHCMSSLRNVYLAQGYLNTAEKLGEYTVHLQTEELGEAHYVTALTMAYLTAVYMRRGKLSQAEELGARVLPTMQRVYGERHYSTILTMRDLAEVYHRIGHLDEAKRMFEKVVGLLKETYGKEHPFTLGAVASLAELDPNYKFQCALGRIISIQRVCQLTQA